MSINFEDMPRLTTRQVAALEEAAGRVSRMTGGSIRTWDIVFHPEVRPGRGNDITAWWADGENMATQYVDVYGNGSLVVSETDLTHNDSDEDHFDEDGICGCDIEAAK